MTELLYQITYRVAIVVYRIIKNYLLYHLLNTISFANYIFVNTWIWSYLVSFVSMLDWFVRFKIVIQSLRYIV